MDDTNINSISTSSIINHSSSKRFTLALTNAGIRKCSKTIDFLTHDTSDLLLVQWKESELHFLVADAFGLIHIHSMEFIASYMHCAPHSFPNVAAKVNGPSLMKQLKFIERTKFVGLFHFISLESDDNDSFCKLVVQAQAPAPAPASIQTDDSDLPGYPELEVEDCNQQPRVFYQLYDEKTDLLQHAVVSFSFKPYEWTKHINELVLASGNDGKEMDFQVEKQSEHIKMTWSTCSHSGRYTSSTFLIPHEDQESVPHEWYSLDQSTCHLKIPVSSLKRIMTTNILNYIGPTWFYVLPHGLLIDMIPIQNSSASSYSSCSSVPYFPVRCYLKDVSHEDLHSYA